jgi:hypothetical protein
MTTTTRSNSTTREAKALQLIAAGAVAITPGQKFATVKGSGHATCKVNKTDGCTCADLVNRAIECKHIIATRILCEMGRAARAEAKATGRCRIPADLARALAAGTAAKADRARRVSELTDEVFNPSDLSPIPAGALVDAKGVPYCHSCGTDLVDGRCPRHYARWAAGFGTAA